jgi:hypothetical protein
VAGAVKTKETMKMITTLVKAMAGASAAMTTTITETLKAAAPAMA